MGLLGKLLAAPLRVVNAPVRALERLVNGGEKLHESERIFSKPLDEIANELEDVDDDE